MDTPTYVSLLRDLLSRDPARVRAANRAMFANTVTTGWTGTRIEVTIDREADLALAEAAST